MSISLLLLLSPLTCAFVLLSQVWLQRFEHEMGHRWTFGAWTSHECSGAFHFQPYETFGVSHACLRLFHCLALIVLCCRKLPKDIFDQMKQLAQQWVDSSSVAAAAAIALEQRTLVMTSCSKEQVKIWNDFRCVLCCCNPRLYMYYYITQNYTYRQLLLRHANQ